MLGGCITVGRDCVLAWGRCLQVSALMLVLSFVMSMSGRGSLPCHQTAVGFKAILNPHSSLLQICLQLQPAISRTSLDEIFPRNNGGESLEIILNRLGEFFPRFPLRPWNGFRISKGTWQ